MDLHWLYGQLTIGRSILLLEPCLHFHLQAVPTGSGRGRQHFHFSFFDFQFSIFNFFFALYSLPHLCLRMWTSNIRTQGKNPSRPVFLNLARPTRKSHSLIVCRVTLPPIRLNPRLFTASHLQLVLFPSVLKICYPSATSISDSGDLTYFPTTGLHI